MAATPEFSWYFRKVVTFVPQCGQCFTAVLDEQGAEVALTEQRLPDDLIERLRAEGWLVAGREWDKMLRRNSPDRLTCASCLDKNEAYHKAFWADLNRPLVKTVSMEAKLGEGWLVGQREGDAERYRWLVVNDGAVWGIVQRYKLRTKEGYSTGWEAYRVSGSSTFHVRATRDAGNSERSSFLWRSRDLGAWGIATGVPFDTPRPEWSRRKKAT